MTDSDDLRRLSLTAVQGPIYFLSITDQGQASPEIQGSATIIGVFHHFRDSSIFNQLTVFATELEFVPVIINGPGFIRMDNQSSVH